MHGVDLLPREGCGLAVGTVGAHTGDVPKENSRKAGTGTRRASRAEMGGGRGLRAAMYLGMNEARGAFRTCVWAEDKGVGGESADEEQAVPPGHSSVSEVPKGGGSGGSRCRPTGGRNLKGYRQGGSWVGVFLSMSKPFFLPSNLAPEGSPGQGWRGDSGTRRRGHRWLPSRWEVTRQRAAPSTRRKAGKAGFPGLGQGKRVLLGASERKPLLLQKLSWP